MSMGKDGAGISGDEHAPKTESLLSDRNRSAANPFFGLGSYLEKSWTLQDTGTGTQDGLTMDSRRDGPGTQEDTDELRTGPRCDGDSDLVSFYFCFLLYKMFMNSIVCLSAFSLHAT